MKKTLIYIVDDEAQIRDLLQRYLEKEGYDVVPFALGTEALAAFAQQPCDLWIIDITMPVMDGYTLCREIRQRGDTPIIIVSAKDEEIDRVLGLELGSDDYIAKPFSPRELLVRVKNIMRRVQSQKTPPREDLVRIGNMVINLPKRQVFIADVEVYLTTKEYTLLVFLAGHCGDPLGRDQIVEAVWGYDYPGDMRPVR